MKKSKKKQTPAPKAQEHDHILTADDPSARDAALTEDAARSGDSEALRAGGKDSSFDDTPDESGEAEESSEDSQDAPAPPPSRRQQRKAARQLARSQKRAFLSRESDLTSAQKRRHTRSRRQAVRTLGTPDAYRTGVPHKTHRLRTAAAVRSRCVV